MLSRRSFLKEGLAVVSLGLSVPSVFGRAAVARASTGGVTPGRTLVVVQLAGGVDGLNTLVPYRDGAYHANRPTLRIREEEVLPLDDYFGFHPAMAPLKDLWDRQKLAIVQGVGYPNPSLSHFKAMDIWQSADPSGQVKNGWLGRYFERVVDEQGHPLSGLSFGRSLPTAFQSNKASIPSVDSLETFMLQPAQGDPQPERREASLVRLYDIYRPANTPFAALLDDTLDSALVSSRQLAAVHAGYKPAVTYPESSLASGLRLLAEIIDFGGAASPLRVGHVTLGGFDTHVTQPGRLAQLLGQLSEGLHAFWQDIEAHGRGSDVLVLTWTEFGRRVRENAQAGTDHGTAGLMFLLGNAVSPGLHGEPPSLTNLDDGNLRYTTDFRSVYASVLEQWLEAPADDVLGAHFPRLPLLRA